MSTGFGKHWDQVVADHEKVCRENAKLRHTIAELKSKLESAPVVAPEPPALTEIQKALDEASSLIEDRYADSGWPSNSWRIRVETWRDVYKKLWPAPVVAGELTPKTVLECRARPGLEAWFISTNGRWDLFKRVLKDEAWSLSIDGLTDLDSDCALIATNPDADILKVLAQSLQNVLESAPVEGEE
jgi:cell division septum initiation protein DivIVA